MRPPVLFLLRGRLRGGGFAGLGLFGRGLLLGLGTGLKHGDALDVARVREHVHDARGAHLPAALVGEDGESRASVAGLHET